MPSLPFTKVYVSHQEKITRNQILAKYKYLELNESEIKDHCIDKNKDSSNFLSYSPLGKKTFCLEQEDKECIIPFPWWSYGPAMQNRQDFKCSCVNSRRYNISESS